MNVLDMWNDALSSTKATSVQRRAGNHEFLLSNFDRDLSKLCVVCDMYFRGIFFQGYKCDYCDCVAHAECLTSESLNPCEFNPLSINRKPPNDTPRKSTPKDNPKIVIEPLLSDQADAPNNKPIAKPRQYFFKEE
jgi:hypothetical protein